MINLTPEQIATLSSLTRGIVSARIEAVDNLTSGVIHVTIPAADESYIVGPSGAFIAEATR